MSVTWLQELITRAPREAFAVAHGAERITYGELTDLSDRLAAQLQTYGVVPGDRVALYEPKSIRAVAELLAILKCGAAYVPIDPSAPADRARFILQHCGIEVMFSTGRPLKGLGEDRGARVLLNAEVAFDPAAKFVPPRITDTHLAYVLYTSGSTGTPKGVAITHAQSLAFVKTATPIFEMTASDVTASHAPFNFDLSIIDLFCTFLAGGRMELVPETWLAFPARVSKLIADAGITVWNSVPSALVQLANKGALESRDLSKLRLIMFAGEPFPIKHLRTLHARIPHAKLLNVYGQTEANSSTYFEVRSIPENDGAVLPAGKTFPNYEVLLLSETGQKIRAPNVEGELYVAGGAVASGYFRDPERSSAAFVQHPLRSGVREIVYRTGDRFAFDENGDLLFRGRLDSAVKVRGFRVELGEVEAAVSGFAELEEAAVIALEHEAFGHVLFAFVVPRDKDRFDPAALFAHLAAKLPRYMLPEKIVQQGALLRTANGKVDRRALASSAALDGVPSKG